ncbi:MAG: hypothetical protein M3Y87_25565 [Myxococcota bacterium]|nr:hypothetical protein [Myxococcota bacterium]
MRRAAREDPSLRATLETRRPLFYDAGPDASLDRPAHVRAGSAMSWLSAGGAAPRLVIAQDDASFLALLDPTLSRVDALPLDHVDEGRRQFDAGRGNKKRKLDLEACCVVRDGAREVLLAWGSGSLPNRERIVVLEAGSSTPRIVDASALYAGLRACTELAGSELNIEGAVAIGTDRVRLFQRGNGAPRGSLSPVDATCDLDSARLLAWIEDPRATTPPTPESIVQWELGSIAGVRLTFTDACAGEGGIAFLAAAEASPDAIEDGEVVGVALGWIAGDGEARWTTIREPDGSPFLGKAEGLAWAPGAVGRRALVIIDRDDPDAPSELCEVSIEGLAAAP